MKYAEILEGLKVQRGIFYTQLKDIQQKIEAIDTLIGLQSLKTDTNVSDIEDSYPFGESFTKRVQYIIDSGGEWSVDKIVEFFLKKEPSLEVNKIKPTITMTASALYKANKVNAKKVGLINLYSKKS